MTSKRTMRYVALTAVLVGILVGAAFAADRTAPAAEPEAAPAADEPVDREAVILRLRARYRAAVRRIRTDQQAWYEKQPKPSLVYQDRFGATARHVDGLDVAAATWGRRDYEGDGEAAAGLNALAKELAGLSGIQADIAMWEGNLEALRARHEELETEAVNARVRQALTGWSSGINYTDRIADVERDTAMAEAKLAELSGRLQSLEDDLAAWDQQEAQCRALDRQQVAALQAQCRARTRAYVAKLEEQPGFAFVVAHDKLVKSIEHTAGVLRLLEDTASREEDETRARELDAKIAERRADLEAKQAELAALVEAYFAPAEELEVVEETAVLTDR